MKRGSSEKTRGGGVLLTTIGLPFPRTYPVFQTYAPCTVFLRSSVDLSSYRERGKHAKGIRIEGQDKIEDADSYRRAGRNNFYPFPKGDWEFQSAIRTFESDSQRGHKEWERYKRELIHLLDKEDGWKKKKYMLYVLDGIVDHAVKDKICLSFSTFGMLNEEMRAFIVYHELGHLELGHVERNGMCAGFSQSYGNNVFGNNVVTRQEDEADAYAITRLAKQKLPIQPVWQTLYENPFFRVLRNDLHSDGRVRAALTLFKYRDEGGKNYSLQWFDAARQRMLDDGIIRLNPLPNYQQYPRFP